MNTPELPRRGFLRQVAGVSAGASIWQASQVSLLGGTFETPLREPSGGNETLPQDRELRLALISAASYGRPGQERISGSNHGTAFATIFNGWDEDAAKQFQGTMVKSTRQIPGCRVTKVWDPISDAATKMAAACQIAEVCATPEACCQDVDGVILIDDGSGRQWQFAEFPLRQGLPVFCDKPLAMTAREANQIAKISEECGGKLMSASSLRFVPDIAKLKRELEPLGKIKLAMATGPGQLVYYGIHALSMVYGVLGAGAHSVRHVGEKGRHVLKIRYPNELEVLLLVTEQDQFPMGYQLQLYGENGSRTIVPDLADLYVYLLEAFLGFIRTGVEPFPVREEVELIAVLEAGERSLHNGKEVLISDMFGQ